jgi:tetratricopeptide (TPR) repeat protein
LTYTKLERLDDSIRILETGLEKIPDSMVILSRLVHFYMRAEEFDKAFQISQRALQMNPHFLEGLIISGWVKNIQGRWTESIEYFKKALEIEPENKVIQMRYAYALGALGRTDEAIEIYDRLKQGSPENFQIYSDLGIIYHSVGNYEKAEENFRKAVELYPSPETYLKYSAILERTGNLVEAIRYLKLYLETSPEKDTPQKISAQRTLADWERRIKE